MPEEQLIDEALISAVLELSGLRTRTEAITLALQEFVAGGRLRQTLELQGSIEFAPDYDYK